MAKPGYFSLLSRGSLVTGVLLSASLAYAEGERFVIPPGHEQRFLQMLCGETTQPALPAGCKCEGVKIDHSFVVGTYACGGAAPVSVDLRHPTVAPDATKTKSFALVPHGTVPGPLLDVLQARVKAAEADWRWIEATAAPSTPAAVAVDAPSAPTVHEKPPGVDDAEWAEYQAGVALYNAGRMKESLAAMIKMARAKPQPMAGVLGMAVASLASTSPTQETVARYVAEAEKDPRDVVSQFLAGVAAHYCGHRQARTREEKNELYRKSIKYLTRTLPQYEGEARVHIYLGVSHYRLGEQAEAETQIEKAVALGSNDADSFYCRAEVYHQKDRAKAIADIQKYVAISEALAKREGSMLSESKQRRVRDMLSALQATPADRPPPSDLWDPVLSPTAQLANRHSPGFFGGVMVTVAAVAAAIWFASSKSRRRKTDQPPPTEGTPT